MLVQRPAFAWPSQCAVCRGWSDALLCGGCAAQREVPRCVRCAIEVPRGQAVCGGCLLEPPPQEVTVAAVDYSFPWDHLIGRFKFHAAIDLAAPLADRLVHAVQDAGATLPDLLLPAPLSVPRLRERGYNQAVVQIGRAHV